MRYPILRSFVAFSLVCASLVAATTSIDPSAYREDVKALSSDAMRGRGTGTPELDKAARYIAAEFKRIGLKPLDGKSYFQAFKVSTNSHLGPANSLSYSDVTERRVLKTPDDFIPLNFSASGKVVGELVFAGYGITAREYNYDDYAKIDAKDKIVVVLRHEPQEFDAKSRFDGKVYTEHSQLFSKAANAKLHGARGLLMVTDTNAHYAEDVLEKFSTNVSPANPGIPFVQVKADVVEHWFRMAGKDFRAIQEEIDRDLEPRSFAFPSGLQVDAQVDVRKDSRSVNNVAGLLPGESDEYIVIGAHYDHLGLGEQFSLAPSMAGTPHPGADDNASGTAGVMALARRFATQPQKPKRGILFLAFAGEELGLLGSSHYVNHPSLPMEKAVAMINMDMIGRIREGKVYVGGVGTGSNFRPLLDEVKKKYPFQLDLSEAGGYGSSDHTSFTTKQVPVLFFFSGLHGDYHKPTDTWDKIDAPNAAKLLEMIADVTEELSVKAERPMYVRVTEPRNPHAVGSSQAGSASGGGYGPYFGSIPDFAEPPTGVRFADVRDGSPAAKAGLKAKDIMVEFDGKKIQNLYDFTYALRSKKPGDEVEVVVLRGEEQVRAKVVLEQRR